MRPPEREIVARTRIACDAVRQSADGGVVTLRIWMEDLSGEMVIPPSTVDVPVGAQAGSAIVNLPPCKIKVRLLFVGKQT